MTEAQGRLDGIRDETTWSTTRLDVEPRRDLASDAAAISGLLRSVADGADLAAAAHLLEEGQPGLAEVLRVYGLGEAAEAEAHLRRHRG
ncbi:hypothetical protein [Ornithinimicrobium sp. Y1694]|uniref:hypothetical protein n=1 Tax=Ornithinimicrobium sp. Y1694 TaxID=3418590 RepID=UPI003CF9CF74